MKKAILNYLNARTQAKTFGKENGFVKVDPYKGAQIAIVTFEDDIKNTTESDEIKQVSGANIVAQTVETEESRYFILLYTGDDFTRLIRASEAYADLLDIQYAEDE